MNILQTRKFIYYLFVLVNLFNPLTISSFSKIQNTESLEIKNPNNDNKLYLNHKTYESSFSDYEENFFNNSKLVKNNSLSKVSQLEIQSNTQYQENNVIYAEGNVLVNFKGNIIKADSLVYDRVNETFEALGNIKINIGSQVFRAEKIKYDFKSQKGLFLKVKGLVKTKSFIDNLDLKSYNSNEISSILSTISKKRVSHTPDGINNWIFYTDELKIENDQWTAREAFFTNDLLESGQVKFKINKLKITPKNDELKIKSALSFLILEDKLPIPFWFGNRTLNKSKECFFCFNTKYYLGFDNVDRDGYFIGRKLNSSKISDNFTLTLEPQFLIQRSLQGYTKSFVKKGASVTSEKSKRDTSFLDYFSLSSELKGKINNWDLKIDKKIYSFDSEKFLDALRVKVDLTKEIDFLNSEWDKSFYGVYRDRIWNGSIGESEIYLGFGSKLSKSNTWKVNGITTTEKFTMGLGKFTGEALLSENLVTSYKGSLFYSLEQKFPIKVKETENKFVDKSFNYIFEPVKQGININTKLAALYSIYENNHHQEYFGFGAGPEIVFGDFQKKYFDYTRIKLFPFYRIKGGDSIFKFDQISDKFTLDVAYDQQLYGPILLKTNGTINLDSDSKSYGDFINSKISLNWKKRSYELGVFYQPHNQSGGINFALYGFE